MRVINTGIHRLDLRYEVKRVTNEREKHEELMRVIQGTNGEGIIYAATVKTVDALADWLHGFDFKVEKYHGRMKAANESKTRKSSWLVN